MVSVLREGRKRYNDRVISRNVVESMLSRLRANYFAEQEVLLKMRVRDLLFRYCH